MKRLFLLLVALFVVVTLQAQVVCYEFQFVGAELTYPDSRHRVGETAPPQGGEKVYWVVNKSQMAAYMANFKGEYNESVGARKMTIIYRSNSANRTAGSLNRKPEYNWAAGNLRYKAPDDFSKLTVEMKTNDGGRYVRSYKRINTLQAREKGTSSSRLAQTTPPGEKIHMNAPNVPQFKSDSSRYKNFREWFMQEMPAQDSIRSVQSITIVIEKDGSVTVEDVTTGTPQNEEFARLVKEVLTRSPKWTPAYDKDGKTPLRFRMKGRDLLLRRTVEGWKRDKESATLRMKKWCEQWGVDVGRVCCQISYADIGGITLEQLGERMKTATQPVVVVAVEETCQPSLNLMEDWNMILKGYEGKYDLYLVLGLQGGNTALREYSKAFRTAETNPSILFVYNKYGMSEERVGYSREKGVELISWFDRMMKKSAF